MAIVLSSPREKQNSFLVWIIAGVCLVLVGLGLAIFFSRPAAVDKSAVFNPPSLKVDFSKINSEQVKKLDPFKDVELEFKYTALTKEKKPAAGKVYAPSRAEAQKILESMMLSSITLEETELGRKNPFSPYY